MQTSAQLPRPGADLLGTVDARFVPAPEIGAWVRNTFLDYESPLCNEDHAHLVDAYIGFLWTNVTNSSKGQTVLGTCQLGKPTGMPWPKGQQEQQRREWFGRIPDFVIILDAEYFARCSEAEACALVEHELYHAGRAYDQWGEPRFTEDGDPVWKINPHDIEEFAGVIERYGAEPTHTKRIKRAFENGPTIADVAIRSMCGICLKVA